MRGRVTIARGQDHPMLHAVHDGSVYWVNIPPGRKDDDVMHYPPRTLMRAALDGASPTALTRGDALLVPAAAVEALPPYLLSSSLANAVVYARPR